MNITTGGSQVWFWLLADCAVKASIVMSAAWLLTRALRRHSAATRHTVWAAAAKVKHRIAAMSTTARRKVLRIIRSAPLVSGPGEERAKFFYGAILIR